MAANLTEQAQVDRHCKDGGRVMLPLYLIETNHGRLGFQVQGYPEDTRASLVRDIADGAHQGKGYSLSRVIQILPASEPGRPGLWNDVTEEIATEVRALLDAERAEISWRTQEWLERVLGLNAARGLVVVS